MPRLRQSIAFIIVSVPVAATAAAQVPVDGREIYRSACAACHGPDGRGMPRAIVGFDAPLPDFTDCSFATPEADADWLAVAHDGGPVRAFDRRMPAFGEALGQEALLRAVSHIRSFCAEPAWPRGELNLPRALVTEKAFPENEAVLTATIGTGSSGAVSSELLYERRIGLRSQFEIALPLELKEDGAGTWRGGLGDVAVALKHVLAHSLARGAIFSAGGEVILPTGKESGDLGAGATVFEPFLTYGQLLPGNSYLQTQAGFELSTDTSRAPHEGFWRVAVGRTYVSGTFGRAWSPAVELLGTRELEGGAAVDWDLVPQLQVSLSRRQHVLVSAGVRIPVNERDARSTSAIAYLLWDWFDGGLFSGWR
jgi:hypothetical protein